MSTTQTDLRTGSVRVALGDLLHAEWDPSNAAGYDPNLAESDPKHLDIHLGQFSEDGAFPQLGLRDVSETAAGSTGYAAMKATGAGPVQDFRGRVDMTVFVGADDDLDENSQLLAKRIGLEAREIIHDNVQGIMDSATGNLLIVNAACSRPRVGVDPDLPEAHYLGRLEVTYLLREEPPERI